jgi:hypothetical protein
VFAEALAWLRAQWGVPVSQLVNVAMRNSLAEDADDLDAFRDRSKEPRLSFEAVVRDMKRRGKL